MILARLISSSTCCSHTDIIATTGLQTTRILKRKYKAGKLYYPLSISSIRHMRSEYPEYVDLVTEDVETCLDERPYQPILFVGSGMSKRYFEGPSWIDLLEHLATECPNVDHDLGYYLQDSSLPEVGQIFSRDYREWAWGDGRDEFPDTLFNAETPSDAYIKYKISEFFKSITPTIDEAPIDDPLRSEIESLKQVQPHAIITTNYDQFLEEVFPAYDPIIGQEVLSKEHESIGEIFKIHGCVSDPNKLVFTEEDYNEFDENKQYLSAKLLTYFAEHPLLIMGYSAEDSNVKKILSDIDKILAKEGDLIPNIYFLQWKEEITSSDELQREKVIHIEDGRTIRIKCITASHFSWVFDVFSSAGELEGMTIKSLRSVAAHAYEIIRTDAAKPTVELDYEALETAADSKEEVAKLFGISTLGTPSSLSVRYPYRASDAAEELGYDHWYHLNSLIEEVENEKGVDIKASDNRYHQNVGGRDRRSEPRYSAAAIELLEKVRDNQEYEIELRD